MRTLKSKINTWSYSVAILLCTATQTFADSSGDPNSILHDIANSVTAIFAGIMLLAILFEAFSLLISKRFNMPAMWIIIGAGVMAVCATTIAAWIK